MTTTLPELQRRLLFALLRPAVRLARQLRIPLELLEDLLRLAYYDELRKRGATQAQIAEILSKSLRTIGSLEAEYRKDFFRPEQDVELHRRVELSLGSGPRTVAEMADAAAADPSDVEGALRALLRAGRASESGGVFRRRDLFVTLVSSDLTARVDGLRNQLDVVSSTLWKRFFDPSDARPAVARTLSFLGRAHDVQTAADELIRVLRSTAVGVEEQALTQSDSSSPEPYGLTFAIAPTKEVESH